MFGKRGFEAPVPNKEITSIDKAARLLSINQEVGELVNRYNELQIERTHDDAVELDETAMRLREIFKEKEIKLGIDEGNNADVKAFVESFTHARNQNTGRSAA